MWYWWVPVGNRWAEEAWQSRSEGERYGDTLKQQLKEKGEAKIVNLGHFEDSCWKSGVYQRWWLGRGCRTVTKPVRGHR
jgi:hypothetical protein